MDHDREKRPAPVLLEEGDPALAAPAPSPADAPPPPEPGEGAAAGALRLAAGGGWGWAGWFWSAVGALVALVASVAAWDFAASLLARSPVLGGLAAVLLAVAALGLVAFVLREAASMSRLARIDTVRADAEAALQTADRDRAARAVTALQRLYAGRPDLAWALEEVKARTPELLDAPAVLEHAERALMTALDARASAEAAKAARTVATVTALAPVALIDVLAALGANLRMIRRIGEIYGGRAGWLGSWRLLRAVAAHLIATGVVAMGDDLLGPALGGGVATRLSRRFGEGLINGALTARVGAAAIAVCRPLPFRVLGRPSGRSLAAGALRGLFGAR
jgi:putative membrane protein